MLTKNLLSLCEFGERRINQIKMEQFGHFVSSGHNSLGPPLPLCPTLQKKYFSLLRTFLSSKYSVFLSHRISQL